jgi:hypothetical protein
MVQPSPALEDYGAAGVAGLTASALLKKKILLVSPHTHDTTPSVLTHPQLREFYPEMLFTLYSTIWATVPLLEAALTVSRERFAGDAVAAKLIPYYQNHIVEELHHDEWMLEDMEVLGMKRREIIERLPPAGIAEAVGAQYYWIYHYHPVAFLGYLAALETDPVSADVVKKAAAESGIPPAAFRTLLIHSEHDFDHCEDLNRLIDGLPLQPQHIRLMSLSAMQIAAAYDKAFTAMLPG